MANPMPFRGSSEIKQATAWFKNINCLRKAVAMNDSEALLVAALYLHRPAELWWDSIEDTIQTWDQFSKAFHTCFAPQQLDNIEIVWTVMIVNLMAASQLQLNGWWGHSTLW
ncbi:hypothetical protein BDF14DRAFT_1887484 [Spinellus fusiger]|nr:hypothetical protein BDF14DRAFT_1887484 [Spinellus fusiger]